MKPASMYPAAGGMAPASSPVSMSPAAPAMPMAMADYGSYTQYRAGMYQGVESDIESMVPSAVAVGVLALMYLVVLKGEDSVRMRMLYSALAGLVAAALAKWVMYKM